MRHVKHDQFELSATSCHVDVPLGSVEALQMDKLKWERCCLGVLGVNPMKIFSMPEKDSRDIILWWCFGGEWG